MHIGTDLHFNCNCVQASEVARRIPRQDMQRPSGGAAGAQRLPVYADVDRGDRSLGEGQDPAEVPKSQSEQNGIYFSRNMHHNVRVLNRKKFPHKKKKKKSYSSLKKF